MDFPSTRIMYVFDFSLLLAGILATVVVVHQWPRLTEMRARLSAILVLLGVWIQASVYVADLFSMTILPILRGSQFSHQFMVNIHTYYGWYASFLSTCFVCVSLMIFTRKFVNHSSDRDNLLRDVQERNDQLAQASHLAKLGYCTFNHETNTVEYASHLHARHYGMNKAEYVAAASTPEINLPLIHPDDRKRVQEANNDVQAGNLVQIEYRVSTSMGQKVIREVKQPLKNKRGKVIREMTISLDVSQSEFMKSELKIAKQRLDAALTGANIGIFDIDLETGQSTVSPTWKSLMGFEADDNIDPQSEWMARVHPDDLSKVKEADAKCVAGLTASSEAEYRIRVRDNSWRWMKSIARTFGSKSGGTPERLIGVQLDITDHKELEQMKGEFVATVSHELRTPVSSIHGALRLLRAQSEKGLPSAVEGMLDIAQRNSERLLNLISDILDFEAAASRRGIQFDISRLRVGDVVQSAVTTTVPLSEAKSIEIRFESNLEDDFAHFDKNRFEQVILNLISNAVKFSPNCGVINIDIERRARNIQVSVTDHGPGVPPDFADRLFEPFSKAGAPAGNVQGAGMGLCISKQLIEGMGGQIGFSSVPDEKTTFWVQLPGELANEGIVASIIAA